MLTNDGNDDFIRIPKVPTVEELKLKDRKEKLFTLSSDLIEYIIYNKFDLNSPPWSHLPEPVIETIKTMVKCK